MSCGERTPRGARCRPQARGGRLHERFSAGARRHRWRPSPGRADRGAAPRVGSSPSAADCPPIRPTKAPVMTSSRPSRSLSLRRADRPYRFTPPDGGSSLGLISTRYLVFGPVVRFRLARGDSGDLTGLEPSRPRRRTRRLPGTMADRLVPRPGGGPLRRHRLQWLRRRRGARPDPYRQTLAVLRRAPDRFWRRQLFRHLLRRDADRGGAQPADQRPLRSGFGSAIHGRRSRRSAVTSTAIST